jgi:hypothetical protein
MARGSLWFSAWHELHGYELWRYADGAVAHGLGRGAGTDLREPALRASDPVLGSGYRVRGRAAWPGAGGVLLFGLPASGWQPLAPGRVLHLAPVPVFVLGAFATAGGQWDVPLAAPNDPGLEGGVGVVQAFLFPSDAPAGYDASGGVVLRFGR